MDGMALGTSQCLLKSEHATQQQIILPYGLKQNKKTKHLVGEYKINRICQNTGSNICN